MRNKVLYVIDSRGRKLSLLNEAHPQQQRVKSKIESSINKRKYYCTEPGCQKSFTTSGHLARHHRIHTGEKNFTCLYPGCTSRFSRQDNMMQHYRTHIVSRSRHYHYSSHHYHYTYYKQQLELQHSCFYDKRVRPLYPPFLGYGNNGAIDEYPQRPHTTTSTPSVLSPLYMSSAKYNTVSREIAINSNHANIPQIRNYC